MIYTNRHTGVRATAYQLTHHNATELAQITQARMSHTRDGEPFLLLPKSHSVAPLGGTLVRLGEWAARPDTKQTWKGYPDFVFQSLYEPLS